MTIRGKYEVEFTENEIVVNGNRCKVIPSWEYAVKCYKRPRNTIVAVDGVDGLKRIMAQDYAECWKETICKYVCGEV